MGRSGNPHRVRARVAGQFAPRHDRLAAARQDGDAVPGLLAAPHSAVARLLDRGLGEFAVGGLKLLQRDNVGLFGAQPADQTTEPLVHVVDVEGRYLHRPSLASWSDARPTRARYGSLSVTIESRIVTPPLAPHRFPVKGPVDFGFALNGHARRRHPRISSLRLGGKLSVPKCLSAVAIRRPELLRRA